MLGETYVEELRLAETPTFPAGRGDALDPRTMGVATAVCAPEVSAVVAGVALCSSLKHLDHHRAVHPFDGPSHIWHFPLNNRKRASAVISGPLLGIVLLMWTSLPDLTA